MFLFLMTAIAPMEAELPSPPVRMEQTEEQHAQQLIVAKKLAFEAGKKIMEKFGKPNLQIEYKQAPKGPIPVTEADLDANELIQKGLKRAYPDDAILSQETPPDANWWENRYVWIVDPLDGAKNFIKGGNQFGVHIGLTENGKPVLGVNYYPSTDTFYYAVIGQGAYKQVGEGSPQRLFIPQQEAGVDVLPLRNTSLEDNRALYETLFGREVSAEDFGNVESAGLRLCSIAEGSYNLYVSTGERGGLWDFASGEVIMREAGGFITDRSGHEIDYQNPEGRLKNGIVISNNEELHKKVIALLGMYTK